LPLRKQHLYNIEIIKVFKVVHISDKNVMKSNTDLVNYLMENGTLKTPKIIKAFKKIDRADFVPVDKVSEAYNDYPLPIGYGQTISQPTTVAFMFELLKPEKGNLILDIGSGSGWTTALLATIVGNKGFIEAVEVIPQLIRFGKENIKKYKFKNARVRLAGSKLGVPGTTFDRILISASAKSFPEEILSQLKNNGRLVIPIQNSIWLYIKTSGLQIIEKQYPGFVFVPLK
jgi:protein-L-isoaspartate(D-aspartate) O-methyltransferase